MAKQKLSVGILGAGYMGRLHAGKLSAVRGVEVAAVCSAFQEETEALASSLPGRPATYLDFEQMLRRRGLDALYICLPPHAHAGQFEAAVEKGIHVFIEKPIALGLEKGRSMVRAARKSGVVTQVGYQMRFGRAVEQLKKSVDSGSAGRPTLFDGRYECRMGEGHPWWTHKDRSGGQVLEQIIHLYDLALYLLGQPQRVTGFAENLCHTETPGYTIEDTSAAAIRFRSGALANISGSNCAVPMQWSNPFTVVCENVTAYFTDANHADFVLTGHKEPRRASVSDDRDVYAAETAAFITRVRGRELPAPTIEDGLQGLQLVSAVLESAGAGGKPIALRASR